MTDNPIITARGLCKSYARSRVLDQLDLTVAAGAAIGLLGANGAGKTTLLKVLLGLTPVEAGRATILGHPSSALPPSVRQRLAYVPQTPTQFPWLTGQAMLRYVSRFYFTFDWDYVRSLSARWKLALRTPIGALSPGQQQRLSIVRALATRPEILVLDEPIASLDPATRIAVIDELLAERTERSLTLIFSSHLVGDLERLCTQFAVLANGRIAVLEDVQWFRGLVRARLEADEGLLADISVPSAAMTRKSGDGRRIVLLERSIAERLRTILPAAVNVVIDQPDLEAAASEWMS